MDYPRSAPSYFTSTLKKLAVSQEATIRCCVRIPLRAFPPSHLAATEDESAVSEDLPRSRAGFHGSLVRPSASGRVARFRHRRDDNFGQTVFVNRFSPVADVLCSSAVSKIKPTFVVARRCTNPPDGNQLRRCTGALPFLKTPRRFHRMLSYAIRVIPAFLGDLMTNAPHFGNQRTVFHFRFPKVRFSRKVCGACSRIHLRVCA